MISEQQSRLRAYSNCCTSFCTALFGLERPFDCLTRAQLSAQRTKQGLHQRETLTATASLRGVSYPLQSPSLSFDPYPLKRSSFPNGGDQPRSNARDDLLASTLSACIACTTPCSSPSSSIVSLMHYHFAPATLQPCTATDDALLRQLVPSALQAARLSSATSRRPK